MNPNMLLSIVFLPIIGSAVSGLLGRLVGINSSKYIATACVGTSLCLSAIAYYHVVFNHCIYKVNLGSWIVIDNVTIDWEFIIDELSVSLIIPITLISSLVHFYSCAYMAHDPYQQRFFSVLSFFTGFMLVLVTGNNYLILFLGWELIGVASYLLISHWFTIVNSIKSGLSALLVNKIGDTFFVIGIIITLLTFGSLNFNTVFSLTNYINVNILSIIMMMFILGAMSKSAQLGLHIWLLFSMAGPTPVSALLHAACLVCAGIYLLIRSSYLLEFAPVALLVLLWVGGITSVFSGILAVVFNDLKKIIALSTMSQLGLMVVAIGLSSYNVSLFHLFTHSMFKALLFLSAGSIIHSALNESQDIRSFGAYKNFIPVTYTCFLIGSLSLIAFPSLSGFYSKDIIIESTLGSYCISGFVSYWLCLVSATMTSVYSFRTLYLVFFNVPNSSKISYMSINELNWKMLSPMVVLALASIFVGYLTREIYLGMGVSFNCLFTNPNNLIMVETEFLMPKSLKLLPFLLSLIAIGSSMIIYEFFPKISLPIGIKQFILQKFYFDQSFNWMTQMTMVFAYNLNVTLERGFLMILGPWGLFNVFNIVSYNMISYSNSHFRYMLNSNLVNHNSLMNHFNLCLFSLAYQILIALIAAIFLPTSIVIPMSLVMIALLPFLRVLVLRY